MIIQIRLRNLFIAPHGNADCWLLVTNAKVYTWQWDVKPVQSQNDRVAANSVSQRFCTYLKKHSKGNQVYLTHENMQVRNAILCNNTRDIQRQSATG